MHRHIITIVAGALLAPFGLSAQEWSYMSYWPDGKPWAMGSLKLRETVPGQHRVHLLIPGGGLDECARAETGARVEQQPEEIVIYMLPRMPGCQEVRFVLKADGTGGRAERKQADGSWQHDGRERELKRR